MLLLWLTAIILFPFFLFLTKSKPKNNLQFPPSPPRLPILGNLHQLGAIPHQSLWKLSKKYGPVMLLQLGFSPNVIISSAEAAKQVMKVHDLDSCSRPRSVGSRKLSYNYLDLAVSPYTDYWREMRKLCVLEVFSLKRVQSFRFLREEETSLLMSLISESASSSTPVNLTEKLYSLTASIIYRMALGKSFRGSDLDGDKFHELVHEANAVVGGFLAGDYFPYFGWVVDRITGKLKNIERVFHELDRLFQEGIDIHLDRKRTNEDGQRGDIIDVMLGLDVHEAVESAQRLTHDHIKGILLNIILGGIDTSAITLIWAMAELIRKPRMMKKVQDEIRNFVGTKKLTVTEDDVDKLEYLNMVVKETLRLHPPVPLLIARETMSKFQINGYDILPKTIVQVNVWGIGRDPNYWKDPDEFYPERFVDNPVDLKGQHFEFLPFGAGRRGCPGMNLGLKTIHIALANLLYRFDWKLPEGMEKEDMNMEEKTGLTVGKKTPLYLVPVKHVEV